MDAVDLAAANASIAARAICLRVSSNLAARTGSPARRRSRTRAARRSRARAGRPARARPGVPWSAMKVPAALITLVLKLPHRPRSAVITMSSALAARPSASARSSSSGCAAGSTRDARLLEHAPHLGRERPRLLDALLRAAQPRRGHHLHRLGDLLRRLDRADPAPDVNE